MPTSPNNSIYALRRSSIAACFIPGDDLRVYFQDFDGYVREVRYKYGVGYLGGDKGSIIESAKDIRYHGPLAAVASQDSTRQVTLFYVSKDSYIRAIMFNGHSWEPFLSINQMNIIACPSTELACLRFDKDRNVRLFYQDQDKNIKELRFTAATSEWKYSSMSLPAIVGSSLACDKWLNDDGSLREVTLFYQDPTCEVRSHFYIAADDEWNYGYLHVSNMPQLCGISTAAHRHLGYNADVSRIYIVQPGGVVAEHSFRSDTEEWSSIELVQSLHEGRIAATWFPLNDNPEVRLFYQGPTGELKGYNFQNRAWIYEHTLPCRGS